MTNGFAEVGLLAVPWLLVVPYVVAVALVALEVRNRQRAPAVDSQAGRAAPTATSSTPVRVLAMVAILLPWLVYLAIRGWDPVAAGDRLAPGDGVAEVRGDGTWQDDVVEVASTVEWSEGEPCLMECIGPRWIYRVQPGETFSFIVTISNQGPVPITLLGRPTNAKAPAGDGLSLLGDDALLSTAPANLKPFEPVGLGVGESVTVVWVQTAADCADPTAPIKPQIPGGGWSHGLPFVYEVLGWRRVGNIWPHAGWDIAGCE